MSTSVEMKYEEESGLRFSKDDFKQQSFEARQGTKQPVNLVEDVIDQPGQSDKANSALAPVVQPADLKAEKAALHHVTGLEHGQFGSVHPPKEADPSVVVFHNRPIQHSPPSMQKPSIARGTSGDPLPSQLELPGAIGEAAGEGLEIIRERAKPQIEKAKELYHIWKGEERRQSGDFSEQSTSAFRHVEPKEHDATVGGGSTMDKAKGALDHLVEQAQHVYEDSVLPQVDKAKELFAGKKTEVRHRRGEKKSPAVQGRTIKSYKTEKVHKAETIGQRLNRYRNTAIEVWDGNEPIVKEKVQEVVRVIKKNKMEIPLLALATLLVLWMSVAFVTWLAFPAINPANEQLVLFDNNKPAEDISNLGGFRADNLPTDTDRAHIRGIDYEGLKMRGMDMLGHMKDKVGLGDSKGSIDSSDVGSDKGTFDDISLKAKDRIMHAKDSIIGSVGTDSGMKDSSVDSDDSKAT